MCPQAPNLSVTLCTQLGARCVSINLVAFNGIKLSGWELSSIGGWLAGYLG
jgi:hypothetical protein